MRLFFFVFGFMIFGKIDAQKVLATELVYQYYKYSDLHMQSTDYLYLLEDNRTLYITGVFSERENSITKNVDVAIKRSSKFANHYYYNFYKKDSLFYKTKVLDKDFFVKERTPEFNWILVDEFKEVNGVELQKATTSFRGRNYTAWCDLETPISIGPWKFNNLPGLAYEITDDAKDYYNEWYLTQIDNDVTVNLDIYSLDKFKKLELKEYVNKSDELKEIATSISNTRTLDIPGLEEIGSATTKINHRIKAQEIKYEWER